MRWKLRFWVGVIFIGTFLQGVSQIKETPFENPNAVPRQNPLDGKTLISVPDEEGDEASAVWYRAVLAYEAAIEFETKDLFPEALTMCYEAIFHYETLLRENSQFQPDRSRFSKGTVDDMITRLEGKMMKPSEKNSPEGGFPWIWHLFCVAAGLVIGYLWGWIKGRRTKDAGGFPLTKNLAICAVLLLGVAALAIGLWQFYDQGKDDIPMSSTLASDTVTPLPSSDKPASNSEGKWVVKPFYPAPGDDDPPLMNNRDIVSAYLKAPNWQARIPYIYHGEKLRSKIKSYYKTHPDNSVERFKMKLFQLELDEGYGGPFWVYQITEGDYDLGGVPLIIRSENGKLKIDWEVYTEFRDQHFVKFSSGEIEGPNRFRVVIERGSEYSGPDRSIFSDLDKYICYEINSPYGGYREHMQFAFVEKGTPFGKKLNKAVGEGDDPLAVIIKIDEKTFNHGTKHFVITDFISEGWFGQK